jgi:hypothetical protein
LRQFEQSDFEILQQLLKQGSGILLTPNTLTEASNLCAYIDDNAKPDVFEAFRKIIHNNSETYIRSSIASDHFHFKRLGLTDAVLLSNETPRLVILTTDAPLALAAQRAGKTAINFFHYKEALA